MREDILSRKEEIVVWITTNQSKAYICKQLKCKPETLESYLKKMNIVYSGNKSGKGKASKKRKSAIEYLQKIGHIKTHLLKIKLIQDGIRKHECEKCKNTKWLGLPIPLELHHVDENHYNNVLDNLQLLCPNCHSQCDNNSGKAARKNKGM